MIKLNYSKASEFINDDEIKNMKTAVLSAQNTLDEKNGAGCDYLGWTTLPANYDINEFERMKKAAAKIRENSDGLVVRCV